MTKQVTIYTTQTCPWCVRVKEYLSQNGVGYIERHIDQDPEALAEFKALNAGIRVPVTVIDGEYVVSLDKDRLKELLSLN